MTVGVIVAGGMGVRMGVLTKEMPKALLPLAGKPLLSHQISLFMYYDIKKIIILAGHQSSIIKEFLHSNYLSFYNSGKIQLIADQVPQGTGGCLASLNKIKENMVIFFGDIAVNMDLNKFINFHIAKGALASIVTQRNDHLHESDVVVTDEQNRCINIYCKPHNLQQIEINHYMVAGVFILDPKIISKIKLHTQMDLVKDILAKEINNNMPIFSYPTNEYLDDIGTPERYVRIGKEW